MIARGRVDRIQGRMPSMKQAELKDFNVRGLICVIQFVSVNVDFT